MSDKELKENLQDEERVENSDTTETTKYTEESAKEVETEDTETSQEDKTPQESDNATDSDDSKEDEKPTDSDESHESEKEPEITVPNTPEQKVEYARKIVESADSEVYECLSTVKKDIEELEEYEKESIEPIIKESKKILEQLGIDNEDIGELPAVNADISAVENADKLYVNDLSSGKGGAFFCGLIGGLVTLAGWYAFAAKEAGMPMIPNSFDMATVEKASSKLSEVIGLGTNAQVGLAVAIASAILVFIIIYSIKVSLQSAKNEEIAKELEEKATQYKSEKEQCKLNLENIDNHLKDLRDLSLKYEVLLDEKNAALRRAIRIERVSSFDDLHENSKKEVEHLMTLIREIERLIEAPVVENGALSQHSANLLRDTKTLLQKHIDNIYA